MQDQDSTALTHTRATLRAFNWSLAIRGFFETICGNLNYVFTAYALALGVTKESMGVFVSMLSFASVVQILGAVAMNRVRDRKRLVIGLGLAEAAATVCMACMVPFVPAGARAFAFAAIIFCKAACAQLAAPVKEDWLASSVPGGLRGRYLGKRFQIYSACTLAAYVATGLIGDLIDGMPEGSRLAGLAALLTVGGLLGAASVIPLARAHMSDAVTAARLRLGSLPLMLRDRRFLLYIAGVAIVNLPFYFVIPYYQAFNIEVLKLPKTVITAMLIASGAMRLILSPAWGRYLDCHGPRRTLLIVAILYVAFFFVYLSSAAMGVVAVFAAWIIGGIGDAAYLIAAPAALYAILPKAESRQAYFVFNNQIGTLFSGVGALVAVPILTALSGLSLRVGPYSLGQFHLLFLGCGLLMIPCVLGSLLFAGKQGAGERVGSSRPV